MTLVDSIFRMFAMGGHASYFGEAVSQKEHALQTAHLAELASAPDSLVVAALLHDVGHLLHGLTETIAYEGVDARHEEGGAVWLERSFGPEVVDPIRLHVAAKRYLCTVDATYFTHLSPASRQSLQLQGGPFLPGDVLRFEEERYHQDAVALRRWDDLAKVPGLSVLGLEHYRHRIESAIVSPR
jgi:[1-hydroxy-2-(trimethylamino)ethyl]phosphonate dioxygenase